MGRLSVFLLLALAACAAAWLVGGSPTLAQSAAADPRPVALIADRVRFDPASGKLHAEGNVQIVRGGEVLSTDRLIYDRRNRRIEVPGPLVLADGRRLVAQAKSAVLDTDLENGLIEGAELLLDRQLQLVAGRMSRTGGRYKVLDKVVATSCYICADRQIPFWQIRARRVIHDEEAREIHFESATLEFAGLPVFHVPWMKIPDPTVDRASGFLVPSFSSSTTLGYSVAIPYYLTLGPHADFTITPRFFSKGAGLLGLEYRRQVRGGGFVVNGALVFSDDLAPRATRSSLTATGAFALPRGLDLEFRLDVASDKSVRDDYDLGIEGEDRLTSFVTLSRSRAGSYAAVTARTTQSLRVNEIDTQIPLVLPEVFARKTWADPWLGGKAGLTFQSVTLLRESSNRMSRAGLTADWSRDWILPAGLVFGAYGELAANTYYTQSYTGFSDGTTSDVRPTLAADLRWPLARHAGRVTHLLEPRIQVVWSPKRARINPNEDSTQLEFEDTNLFSINRFPGYDRSERGLRANVGLTWARLDPEGWSARLTVGRVFRREDLGQFGTGTGLSGKHSDFVTSFAFSWQDRIDFVNRTLFASDFSVSKNEALLSLDLDRIRTQASYVWLEQNVVAGASDPTHEFGVALEYRRNDYWTYIGQWRQNLHDGSANSGLFGIRYENECVAISLSYSLQFQGSGIVRPTRELGLRVELAGLGNKSRKERYANRCRAI